MGLLNKHLGQDAGIEWGVFTTVTAADVIQTRLRKVEQIILTFSDDPAQSVDFYSAVPSGLEDGKFTLKSWRKTADGANAGVHNVSVAVATVFSKKVHWVAFGF